MLNHSTHVPRLIDVLNTLGGMRDISEGLRIRGAMAKTVLAFLPEGVEEIEFVTPVDIWRRAGFDVTVAALRYGAARSCSACAMVTFALITPAVTRSAKSDGAAKGAPAATGRSNITLLGDVLLDEVASRDFDCVFCPGDLSVPPRVCPFRIPHVGGVPTALGACQCAPLTV